MSDTYSLTVVLERGEPAVESEPNDTATDASTLTAEPMGGWLDRRDDVDVYRFTGERGRYHVMVSGAAQVPIWLRHGADQLSGHDHQLDLAPGDVISIGRSDRDRPREQDLPGADQRYLLTVQPAR